MFCRLMSKLADVNIQSSDGTVHFMLSVHVLYCLTSHLLHCFITLAGSAAYSLISYLLFTLHNSLFAYLKFFLNVTLSSP